MSGVRRRASRLKGALVRSTGAAAAAGLRRVRRPGIYRPGVTVMTVNWNSLSFLRGMLEATRAMSPPDTEMLVVDNGSSDGSVAYLASRVDVRTMRLPMNVGHGVALDLGAATVDTEFLAVLDVDAFPVSDRWLDEATLPLRQGAQVAGAHMHRNFVHPCFLVIRTATLHEYGLTFRPVGSLAAVGARAPLFLDVGEGLSQRLIVRFGGGSALHFFEMTSQRGPDGTGAVFGELVYHNQYATQGSRQAEALEIFEEALHEHHPDLGSDG